MTPEEIREYWSQQARRFGESAEASWSDIFMLELERAILLPQLSDGDAVLEVGCANGHATVEFARRKNIQLLAIDWTPEMVEIARGRLGREAEDVRRRVRVELGDVRDLASVPAESFDKVICVRVIINLPTWEEQSIALRELGRVVKPGGLVLLSEATLQGWERMNAMRSEWALAPIPMPPFNRYLDERQVENEVAQSLRLRSLENFASTYFVGTRILKPLIAGATGAPIDPAKPDSEWNRFFASLPAHGDYGTQKLFVFVKV